MERSGVCNTLIETDDIEHLSNNACDSLDCGDKVIKVSKNKSKHAYVVAYKNVVKGEMSLVYTDHETIEELYFEVGENGWELKEKSVVSLELVADLDKALFTH